MLPHALVALFLPPVALLRAPLPPPYTLRIEGAATAAPALPFPNVRVGCVGAGAPFLLFSSFPMAAMASEIASRRGKAKARCPPPFAHLVTTSIHISVVHRILPGQMYLAPVISSAARRACSLINHVQFSRAFLPSQSGDVTHLGGWCPRASGRHHQTTTATRTHTRH